MGTLTDPYIRCDFCGQFLPQDHERWRKEVTYYDSYFSSFEPPEPFPVHRSCKVKEEPDGK